MKKFVLAGFLIAASLFLAGCAPTGGTGNGSHPTKTPSAGPGTVACVDGEADFTASNTQSTLAGVCKKVVISGHDITITAADVTSVTVSGDKNTINAAVIGSATIVGDSNTIKTTTVGPITVNGNSNTVTAVGPIGDVSVNGANDTITTPGKIGTITQSGIGNKIGAP